MTLFHTANAIEVEMLHQADVPVESRAKAVRERALIDALKLVFVKNSGNDSVLQNELVQKSYVSPHRFLNQFLYVEVDRQLMLRATFDHRRVLSTLRKAQLPIWGNQRPLTLFWIASNESEQRSLISDVSTLTERQLFQQISQKKAIPTLFPLLDLDDLMHVSVSDVRGKFIDVVGQASNRYQTDFFSIGSIETSVQGVSYQLDLYPYGTVESYVPTLLHLEGTAIDRETAIHEIVVGLSDYYASRYGISESSVQQTTHVAFADVNDMKKLVEIENYLSSLSAVKSLQLSHIQGDMITFDIALFGTEADLLGLLKLESKISKIKTSYPGYSNDRDSEGNNNLADSQRDPNQIETNPSSAQTQNIYLWRHNG